MNLHELTEKEYYIIDCINFVYFARPVHIIAIGKCAEDEELTCYLDIKDYYSNDDRTMYLGELERFKTLDEAQKEADRLNEIPSNKERAKEWNTTGRIQCEIAKALMENQRWGI